MVHAVHGSAIVKMCGVCGVAALLALLAFAQHLLKKKEKMDKLFRISSAERCAENYCLRQSMYGGIYVGQAVAAGAAYCMSQREK